MFTVRERRLPHSLPRSPSYRARNRSSENSVSWPTAISRAKNQRSASTPNVSAYASGFTTLPTDLLIFPPATSHQPCATIRFGSGIPAARSIAGQ
jgi:hypothetical protein